MSKPKSVSVHLITRCILLVVSIFLSKECCAQQETERYFAQGVFTKVNGFQFSGEKIFFGDQQAEFYISENRKEVVQLSDISSFTYYKGSDMGLGAAFGLGLGLVVGLTADTGLAGSRGALQITGLFSVLGGLVGSLNKKYETINNPEHYFASSRLKGYFDVSLTASGVGLVYRF